MKKLNKVFIVLLTLICVTVAGMKNVQAEKYKYHVTVLAGLHGTITYNGESGLDKVDVYLEAGELWNPNDYKVTPVSKEGEPEYEFIRFQISGIEAREGTLAAVPVNEDMVFVAQYGFEGSLIEYHVKYVDENGKELLPQATFHGNPGDYPVVAFQYIEGYLPEAYNLEGLKLEEGKDNTFTFTYSEIPEEEVTASASSQGSSDTQPALLMNVNGQEIPAEQSSETDQNAKDNSATLSQEPEVKTASKTAAEQQDRKTFSRLSWAPYALGGTVALGGGAAGYLLLSRKKDDLK